MLKLLIEKDKSNTCTEISEQIRTKLSVTQSFEDDKYIIFLIGAKAKRKSQKPLRRDIKRVIRETVEAITEYMVFKLPEHIVRQNVLASMGPINGVEYDSLEEMAVKGVMSEVKKDIKLHKKRNWYTEIYRRILVNMLENGVFAVSAFIRFRLDDFKKYISMNTEAVLATVPSEVRYMEFINSLQQLVDKRAPKIYELKLEVNKNEYRLTDGNGAPVDIAKYEHLTDMKTEREDLLVSVLLVLAPVRLVVIAEDEFFNTDLFCTISNVFGERVVVDYARNEN